MRDNPFKIKQNTVKDRSVKDFNAGRTAGDNLLFLPTFSGWLGKSLKGRHLTIFYVVLFSIFAILIGRVVYVQGFQGDEYYQIAENNRLKIISLKAPRGIIYDRFERPLVQNVPQFTLSINPGLIQSDEQAVELKMFLLETFPDESETLNNFFNNFKNQPETLLIDDIEYERALQLLSVSSNWAAIEITYEPRREYLYNYGLGHVLGYVGRITQEELEDRPDYGRNDTIGKAGIEAQYEKILKGADGSITFEVDAFGREKSEVSKTDARIGSNITLTIDIDIQKRLYEELERVVIEHKKPAAAGVVLDPSTGEVLAIASYPSFDPNIFTTTLKPEIFSELLQDEQKPLFMRAIAGEYPSGSIFKMAVASAALEEGLITDNFSVVSTGGVQLGNRFFPDWRAGGHGVANVYRAISESINTFFYIIGGGTENFPGLGVDLISQYARKLGFDKPTGIDLPGESSGFVPTREWKESIGERWYQGDTYNLSIGQGQLTVTPIQVAHYTTVFANGEYLAVPRLLKQIHSVESESISVQPPRLLTHGISKGTIATVREGMRRTITSGTARSMQSVSVPVSGKTGTAQFNRNKNPHSWFTGYAPSDDPEIELTVLVEEGGDVGYAVTASRRFLEWYFNERE